MKNWLTTLGLQHWLFAGIGLLLLGGLGVFLAPGTDSGASSPKSGSEISSTASASIVMEVNGMYCSGCVRNVEQSLSALDDVEQAEVTLEENKAEIWVAGGASLEDETLKTAVEEAGYEAGSVERPEGSNDG